MAAEVIDEIGVIHVDDPYAPFRRETPTGDRYSAGLPGYPEDFTRDGLIAAFLASNPEMLRAQLESSVEHQGVRDDPATGERQGRIHHQFPGVEIPGRQGKTTYNAGDTTALFLIGVEGLLHLDPGAGVSFIDRHRENIEQAVGHVLSCVGADNLYWEQPPEGASQFALRVTMWKDSTLPQIDGKLEPVYPVTYGLTHFIVARSLLSAAEVLERPELAEAADAMFRAGIRAFMTERNGYVVYRDRDGELVQPSSDEICALAFIPAVYGSQLPLDAIRERARVLESPYGNMCTPEYIGRLLCDQYHGAVVWPYENALHDYGARKFGLDEVASVATRVAPHIGAGRELLRGADGRPEGNARQLWSVAAAAYFAGDSILAARL